MNKKEARLNRQRRDKRRRQNLRAIARAESRRQQIAAFRVDFVSKGRMQFISKHCLGEICFFCGKRVTVRDLKAGRFIALESNERKSEYVLHHGHFFEDDLQTQVAGAGDNLKEVFRKIFKVELGHLLQEDE